MTVMNPSLCIDTQPFVYLPPLSSHFGKFHGRYYPPTGVPMQSHSQIKFPSLKAVASTGGAFFTKGFGFGYKSKTSVFACNAALNAKCSQGQTQTVTRESPTITLAPTHGKEKSPKLDDGGSGFPPRDDGGGGGGGGGGESFSGGFFLFGFLMFMGYLKDLEGEHESSH
ncbi:protein YELLOW LEAF 1, choloroplastic [Raphanus sativus]|uniref:Protein YELLOW LEAF 1, choloroplastic n=1 Tax=Raphanus sativus TaxID=3726 RepID=A0A6J0NVD7_RAPSA|nr:protein YELLOW LEAF 1, choloroplastic [Raphanus sativus]XP_018488630.1 protein YELLOW LEAF 1, choloroplastic [Raphanus sativus]